jgi:integrase/recombinase XerD
VEKGLSANTLESYSLDLVRFLDALKGLGIAAIDQVDNSIILKYLIGLRQDGLGARSRARHLVAIRGFFRFLVHEKLTEHDPSHLVDLPKTGLKLPDVLSSDEVVSLLNAPDANKPTGLRDSAMLELLYAAGLRVSELVSLKVLDVNLDAGFVRFLERKQRRMVPIGIYAKAKVGLFLQTARGIS